MSAVMQPPPRRGTVVAWVGIVGGAFVVAVAVAVAFFVFLDVIDPPPRGWGFGFFALVADLVLLGSAMAANGVVLRRTGKASRLLQELTIPFSIGVAVISLHQPPINLHQGAAV